MSTSSTFEKCLEVMEDAFYQLEKTIPPPQKVPVKDSFVFRFNEKNIHQAIVQKLARVISGLNSAYILNEQGFIQEQAAIHRMLDELGEDIVFLCYAILIKPIDLHRHYLSDFYQEDYKDPYDPVSSRQRRASIPRKKIRAYIADKEKSFSNPSIGIDLSKFLNQIYSGFVHGASPHIMEMYGGNPPHFHVRGMKNTSKKDEYQKDLRNYFYRGFQDLIFATKVFGLESLVDKLLNFKNLLEKEFDMNYSVK